MKLHKTLPTSNFSPPKSFNDIFIKNYHADYRKKIEDEAFYDGDNEAYLFTPDRDTGGQVPENILLHTRE